MNIDLTKTEEDLTATDVALLHRLQTLTAQAFTLWKEIEDGDFGTGEEIEEIQDYLDHCFPSHLLREQIQVILACFQLARHKAIKAGMGKLIDRLNQVEV